jgi:hypothetical protein
MILMSSQKAVSYFAVKLVFKVIHVYNQLRVGIFPFVWHVSTN